VSLALSPPCFGFYSSSYPATPADTVGTAWTAGASGADGTAVSLISAITHDVHKLRVRVGGISSAGNDGNACGDLLIDPAGGSSWSVLISDLVCGMSNIVTSGGLNLSYEFPLYVPSGSSIGWRGKTAHTVDITTGYVTAEAWGEPRNPAMWWCGSGVETLGISDSKGTAITPGNSGAWGSWTSIGSTSSRIYKAVQLGINGSDNTALGVQYHFEIGTGSAKLPGTSRTWVNLTSSELGYRHNPGLIGCNLPSGTQMQARGVCSGTAENLYGVIYGVY
jgi:hypothetical protein